MPGSLIKAERSLQIGADERDPKNPVDILLRISVNLWSTVAGWFCSDDN
jgi:hypothetical protein